MVQERFDISGRTAIVTGSSQGIGKTIAETYADADVDVTVCSRSPDTIAAVAERINDAENSGRAIAVECDVTDADAVEQVVDETVDAFGGVDILVNNAGGSFMVDLEELSENGWKTIVDINLHGAYHFTQAAGDVMRADGGGTIINISSVGGLKGAPDMAHYGAAKAGLVNFTTTTAYEWAEYDIRANCIAPGIVATAGLESQMGITATDIDRTTAHRRAGLPIEIADACIFLVSEASSFITGETIPIRGVPVIEVQELFPHERPDA